MNFRSAFMGDTVAEMCLPVESGVKGMERGRVILGGRVFSVHLCSVVWAWDTMDVPFGCPSAIRREAITVAVDNFNALNATERGDRVLVVM